MAKDGTCRGGKRVRAGGKPIIDRDFGVIAGHGRILAAKEEGIAEVPCVYADFISEAQKKAYIFIVYLVKTRRMLRGNGSGKSGSK